MSISIGNVLTSASSHLNDANQTAFPTSVMLPFCKDAVRKLQKECLNNNIPFLAEEYTEATVAANATTYSGTLTDLVEPVELHERPVGSTNPLDFEKMIKMSKLPDRPKDTKLREWAWREHVITFVGATVARSVRVRGWKLFPSISDTSSTVAMDVTFNFLSFQTAAWIADRLGENPSRFQTLQADAQEELDSLIAFLVKQGQDLPVRRIGFGRKFRP